MQTFQDINARVDTLLNRMTLNEKIGQMIYLDCSSGEPIEAIRCGRVGVIANVKDAVQADRLQKIAVRESRLGIPLFFGNDVVHGFRTIFPIPLAEASSWDPELMEETAAIAARESIASGTQLIYGPMVDLTRDPRWGRIAESPGEDPYLGSVFASAKVRGFQRNDWNDKAWTIACAKHFVGYGDVEGGRDYNTTNIPAQKLHELYLPPFVAAIQAGVKHIMAAFNDINGIPMTAHSSLIKALLKEKLDFEGFVVSDYNAIAELISHGIAANPEEACEKAILAGVDMDMNSGIFLEYLPKLVDQGKIPIALIDDAVRRILTAKFWANLFEFPYTHPKDEDDEEESYGMKYADVALDAAQRSIVLLKNEDSVLPLRPDIRSLAVIGPLADSNDLLGCWPCYGDAKKATTILDGIRNVVGPQTIVRYAKGCAMDPDLAKYYRKTNPESAALPSNDIAYSWLFEEEVNDGFSEAVAVAEMCDAAIVVVGEASTMSGEANCRSTLDLPGKQLDLVKAVYQTGTPVIVVLMNGRPLVVEWMANHVPAILEAWHLGVRASDAVANVIFGRYNPSGKLPVTFPRATGQIPIYYNHKNTGRPDGAQPHYISRYFDLPSEPLFPFGHGLSYTQFKYEMLTLSTENLRFSESLEISTTIKNIGQRFGEEVVQLYIRDMTASIARPIKELKGFQKVPLHPGEQSEVIFYIRSEDLGYFDDNGDYQIEPGKFTIWVGPSSSQGLESSFTLIKY